jgi:hypothetical protein
MKKVLFFALAALALVLTACDPNKPSGPTDPESYVGQMWRIDSCFTQGHPSGGPHFLIEVKSSTMALFNGSDTVYYKFEDDKLIMNRWGSETFVTVVKTAKDFAQVRLADGLDIFLSRIPEPEGPMLERTKENIIGTWKEAYWMSNCYKMGGDPTTPAWSDCGTDHGVGVWTFKADGTLTTYNTMDMAFGGEEVSGWWTLDEQGHFSFGVGEKPAEGQYTKYLIGALHSNFMVISSTGENVNNEYCQLDEYFTKVQ